MAELQATEVRKGHIVKWNDQYWSVMSVDHITPGNWRAIIQIKMRNLQTGASLQQRFSSGDKLEQAFLEIHDAEFSYQSGETYVFMNTQTYEQYDIHKDMLGDDVQWLTPNLACKINFLDGRAVSVELPPAVDLKVVETEPGLRGATITNVYKPAKLETGAVV
ncbi:MAG: elongation factor P, partial [Planctomycetes bacterium]|nr:elongation factor P [Planctomycetota bacterium]